MSEVLNDRDAILQAAAVRIVNPKNAQILLTPVPAMFHLDAGGVPDAAEITVTAALLGLEGNVTFEADGATLTSVTGKSAVVRLVDMQGPTAIVRARLAAGGETFVGTCIIGTLTDGASGDTAKVIVLTPSQHVFKIDKSGANAPASITLTASGQNLGGTPSFTVPVGTATLTAGANSLQKILTFANMGTDSVTIQVTQDGVSDRVTIVKLREGQDGQPGADATVAVLSNESVTLPASSAGAVSSFSGAVCTMSVYKGTTDDSANWTYAFSPASAANRLTYTASGRTVTITGMAAGVDTAYVDIVATKGGVSLPAKRFTVTKSKAGASVTGARGAGHYYAAGTAWSDGAADAATPGDNVVGDVVTISSGTFVMERRWTGSAWVDNGVVIPGNLIVPGSVLGSALKAGTVEIRTPEGKLLLGAGGEFGVTVTARNLSIGTPDNIMPDPRFKDLTWWGRVGSTVGQFAEAGQVTGWKGGASLYLNKDAGELISNSEYFDLVPGATYRIEVQVSLSNDFNGRASVYMFIPGDRFYSMVNRDTGQRWSDGQYVQVNASSPKGLIAYSTMYTVPASGTLSKALIQIRNSHTAGIVEVGSVSVTRVADGSLVGDGVLEARHIIGDTLDVLAAYLGRLEIGPGGHVRQGMTDFLQGTGIWLGDHGGVPKLAIGRAGGGRMYWDGSKLVLENPEFNAKAASISSNATYFTTYRNNQNAWMGSHTMSVTGMTPVRYAWSVTFDTPPSIFSARVGGSADTAQISLNASVSSLPDNEFTAYLTCTAYDAGGLSVTARAAIVLGITS